MKFSKIHNKGQAQLFRNPALEFFTKSHPLIIWGMYVPIIACLLYFGQQSFGISPLYMAIAFFSGMFFWTFFEYVMHRFVFHYMAENETAVKIVYVIHGNHHEYPRDKERLFMPPLPSLILSTAIFSLMFVIGSFLGLEQHVFFFFPGFVLGYLLYGSMHYAIHAWKPPFKWMKALWRNHHLHHYKNEEFGFGVSTTLWDHVFGTMFSKEDNGPATSETAPARPENVPARSTNGTFRADSRQQTGQPVE
jgi:sterol desaturase/sphingolipid hydroxylase (fatty acid hydroxylase superfamily)